MNYISPSPLGTVYPDPICPKCNSKRGLMFYQGKIECSNCSVIVWEHRKNNQ